MFPAGSSLSKARTTTHGINSSSTHNITKAATTLYLTNTCMQQHGLLADPRINACVHAIPPLPSSAFSGRFLQMSPMLLTVSRPTAYPAALASARLCQHVHHLLPHDAALSGDLAAVHTATVAGTSVITVNSKLSMHASPIASRRSATRCPASTHPQWQPHQSHNVQSISPIAATTPYRSILCKQCDTACTRCAGSVTYIWLGNPMKTQGQHLLMMNAGLRNSAVH